jgi:hypothetical protein
MVLPMQVKISVSNPLFSRTSRALEITYSVVLFRGLAQIPKTFMKIV